MEVKHNYKITRVETNRLSDFKKQQFQPLRGLLLNYVEDDTQQITTNVKLKLI